MLELTQIKIEISRRGCCSDYYCVVCIRALYCEGKRKKIYPEQLKIGSFSVLWFIKLNSLLIKTFLKNDEEALFGCDSNGTQNRC